jgi:sialate O-acetylesterase
MVKKYFCLLPLLLCMHAFAQVSLHPLFTSHMVLQRQQPIRLYGTAAKGERIMVSLAGNTIKTKADKQGNWMAQLPAMEAGGPYQAVIIAANTLTLDNIMIGDVWLCSGQSNMEWKLSLSSNAKAEIAAANNNLVRHFEVKKTVADQPLKILMGSSWQNSTPETAGNFTAVGYHFAKTVTAQTGIAIGLLHSSWGGSMIETWISRDTLVNDPYFKQHLQQIPFKTLADIKSEKRKAMLEKIARFQSLQPVNEATLASWKNADFDDILWPAMQVPGLWENQAPGNYDGVMWFRKTFEADANMANSETVLSLGTIDDAEDTYINGIKVGSTVGYNILRRYTIAPGVLKPGLNHIAVRVEDWGGGGGFGSQPAQLTLSASNQIINLAGAWKFQAPIGNTIPINIEPNEYPSLLYNGMIEPLIHFPIKGVLWYQGETNAGRAYEYRKALPLLIANWRQKWKQPDLPFYFVQLSSYFANGGTSNKGSGWAELREAQQLTLTIPQTGMAVTTDIGETNDIHPTNKMDVGKRLAAIALTQLYNIPTPYQGPTLNNYTIKGNEIFLEFNNTGSGLTSTNKYGYLFGFELAGADRKFKYAQALIKNNSVIVYVPDIKQPVAVRYNWADDAGEGNLYNSDGLPAPPFRTDNWPGITEKERFAINF